MTEELPSLAVQLLLLFAGLALSYFFGLIAIASDNYSSSKLLILSRELPEKRRERILALDNRWREIFASTSFLRILANLAAFAPTVVKFSWPPTLLFFVEALVVVTLLYIFGYSLPRAVARRDEETVFIRYGALFSLLAYLLIPFVLLSRLVDITVGRITGSKPEGTEQLTEEEILDVVSDGETEGVLETEEKEMIKNIISYTDVPASEVMTNRSEVTVIESDTTLEDAARLAVKGGHSRIPVIKDDRDNVIGILYVKDLLKFWNDPAAREIPVRNIMRDAVFVPETKPIDSLFAELRNSHVHFAIVLDEYGGTAGIITIEDILEEIVGEIEDEYDPVKLPEIQKAGESTFIIEARVELEDLNNAIPAKLPESDKYDTLGGLLMDRLGHIPKKGEKISVGCCDFTILESEARTVNSVKMEIIERDESEGSEDDD
ncbi:MAG: hemolysin family protein [Planctomycetota bacterium]|nr:hemolysin family protein [Planctomycetota bacterium]